MILSGRTILITGGSAGIGLAFALKFVELGNTVIVTGRRESVLDEVKKRHPKLHTIQSDVADPAQIATLATRVKAEFPKLDVLMNNAGIMLTGTSWRRRLTVVNDGDECQLCGVVNDFCVYRHSQAKKGTVITSSALAFVPLPSRQSTAPPKAAHSLLSPVAHGFTGETCVEVIELMPPAVKTDLVVDIAKGGGITLMTTEELVKQSFASLKTGVLEIRPGQAKQLAFMRRLAPGFINRQLWKASKKLVPVVVR